MAHGLVLSVSKAVFGREGGSACAKAIVCGPRLQGLARG